MAVLLAAAAIGYFVFFRSNIFHKPSMKNTSDFNAQIIKLPEPRYKSKISLERALLKRRSIREYRNEPLSLAEISQLLWSAQGITDAKLGSRTAPSAGAMYPLEIYVVAGNIDGLAAGVYKHKPNEHELQRIAEGDKRDELYELALGQSWIKDAPAVIIFCAVFERTTGKYGERGIRYVYMEAGHAAQNVYLQAVTLGLGTVTVGAFEDEGVKKLLQLGEKEQSLYLMPVGKSKQ